MPRVQMLSHNGKPVGFAGSMADARQLRMQVAEKRGLEKSQIEIEESEIPTSKPELLAFVNNLLTPPTE